jgi:hypothetical protein
MRVVAYVCQIQSSVTSILSRFTIHAKMGRIVIILLGVTFLFAGLMETKLRLRSSDVPTAYTLADLESGSNVSNLNGTIDKHYALYDALVFSYRTRDSDEPPKQDERVEDYWYPIVSQKPSDTGEPIQFRVIVRRSKGCKVNELPQGLGEEPQIQGLFLNGFHSLRGKERELLEKSFPHLDFNQILLFQEGRHRGSISRIAAFYIGGALLVFVPIVAWHPRKRKSIQSEQVASNG